MAKSKNLRTEKAAVTSKEVTGRPPVVAVLGHVDHGKTSLLDYIRKSHVASKEAGGITQHIGAYQIDYKGRKITFIDTPGHEAFSSMRARGGQAADEAILVVAADDGVMPQTKESIAHIKAANIPFLVAINKIDLPNANLEKVKKQLAEAEVLIEGYGGDVVAVPVSAKTGQGVEDLLEIIALLADMQELKTEEGVDFKGIVIESKMDKSQGPVATVLVKEGKLKITDLIFSGTTSGKVKALESYDGTHVKEAHVSDPILVLGFSAVPKVGEIVTNKAPSEAKFPQEVKKIDFRDKLAEGNTSEIRVIIKADSSGSLEAIEDCLLSLQKDDQNVKVFFSATGDITDGDVLLAASTRSLIIGFNVKISPSAEKIAKEEKVLIRQYKLIYDLLDELKEGLQALSESKQEEQFAGTAQIIQIFKSASGKVAGCQITSGRINKDDLLVLKREQRELGRSKIASMKQRESAVTQVQEGEELGIILEKELPFAKGDIIAAVNIR